MSAAILTASPSPTTACCRSTTARSASAGRTTGDGNRQKTMTLEGQEFIRRFLIHVLPDGFHRIRYYGFLANRHRAREAGAAAGNCWRCGRPPPATDPPDDRIASIRAGRDSLRRCPHCHTRHHGGRRRRRRPTIR